MCNKNTDSSDNSEYLDFGFQWSKLGITENPDLKFGKPEYSDLDFIFHELLNIMLILQHYIIGRYILCSL